MHRQLSLNAKRIMNFVYNKMRQMTTATAKQELKLIINLFFCTWFLFCLFFALVFVEQHSAIRTDSHLVNLNRMIRTWCTCCSVRLQFSQSGNDLCQYFWWMKIITSLNRHIWTMGDICVSCSINHSSQSIDYLLLLLF